jgi:hypothetical protein
MTLQQQQKSVVEVFKSGLSREQIAEAFRAGTLEL